MWNKNNSGNGKLKGFSLIELIVVIAIIGILSSILTAFIVGWMRDARIDGVNSNARLVHQSVQNAVTQWEIKNDLSFVEWDTPAVSPDYVGISFYVENGEIPESSDIAVYSYTVSAVSPWDNKFYDSSDGALFTKFCDYLTRNLSVDFTGYCAANIDYKKFTVKNAGYCETGNTWVDDVIEPYAFSNSFRGFGSYDAQQTYHETNGYGNCVGVYPFLNEDPTIPFSP